MKKRPCWAFLFSAAHGRSAIAASDRPSAPLPSALRGISHTGEARPGPVTEAEYTVGFDAVGIMIARPDS
jgi:hypothetical protein